MKLDIDPHLKGKKLFDYLVKNKRQILDMKKSAIKIAEVATFNILIEATTSGLHADKSHKGVTNKYLYDNDSDRGILKRTIVANAYNWMDSHDDVHLSGIFNKSINDRGNRIPHLYDHKFSIEAKVGNPINYSERTIAWSELGVNLVGYTEALFLESEILKEFNDKVYREYLNNRIDQHSVSMRYINIDLAINDEDYTEEYKVWQSVINRVGNKEKAAEQGYFYAVREAALIEVSAVLLGSNELTPTMGAKFQSVNTTEDKQSQQPAISAKKLLELYKV